MLPIRLPAVPDFAAVLDPAAVPDPAAVLDPAAVPHTARSRPSASRSALFAAWCLLVAALAPAAVADDGRSPDLARAVDAATRLDSLVEREWQNRLDEDPLLATRTGRPGSDHLLPEISFAGEERRARAARAFLDELETIELDGLDRRRQLDWQVLHWQLGERLAAHEVGTALFPINADSGFHTMAAGLPRILRLRTVDDYEAYIARLHAMPALFDGHIAFLRRAMEKGWTQPKATLEGYEGTIRAHVVQQPEDSVFYQPFVLLPKSVPRSEHGRLIAAGREAVEKGPVAAYARFADFFVEEYRPAARETVGASAMPGGEAFYANRIRFFTTLDMTADQVHQVGLEEVRRIRQEMEAVIAEVEFDGSFADFLAFLRTDPRFYAETPEALLKEAAYLAKKMDAQLPRFFGRLPRQPYGVEPVPDYLAPKYTAGRYVPSPLDSERGGTYWVNTYALDKRPLYALEALTLHEAVPGHHLQGALSKELDLPEFRKQLYISAFGEGWGLYSERLGLEAGFYTDPYSNFGRLTYEMWRACRLVVDTGLHAKGWTRQQAIDYLASNTALSLHEVTTEIDRYITWPGQALSYKIGELRIRQLRAEAEAELGSDFDIREFHDQVLSNGAVPLPVLETVIRRWISETSGRARVETPSP